MPGSGVIAGARFTVGLRDRTLVRSGNFSLTCACSCWIACRSLCHQVTSWAMNSPTSGLCCPLWVVSVNRWDFPVWASWEAASEDQVSFWVDLALVAGLALDVEWMRCETPVCRTQPHSERRWESISTHIRGLQLPSMLHGLRPRSQRTMETWDVDLCVLLKPIQGTSHGIS